MPKLSPSQLRQELGDAARPLRSVYLLAGEEEFGKNEAVRLFRGRVGPDDFNFQMGDADKFPAGEVVSSASTSPVFSPLRLIIVRRVDKYKKDDRETLAAYIANPLETTALVLVSDEKKAKDESLLAVCDKSGAAVIEYAALKEEEAEGWVSSRLSEEGIKASPDAVAALIESVGPDLQALDMELGKLSARFHGSKKVVSPDDVLDSLGFQKGENRFELENLIFRRDGKAAARLLDALLASGEEPVGVCSIFVTFTSRLIKAKRLEAAGIAPEKAAGELGMHPYFAKGFMRSAAAFTDQNGAMACFAKSLDTDAQLKSSAGDPGVTLRHLLFFILSRARRG